MMERNPLGFTFYKDKPTTELISKRRKLSVASNGSDSTGEKVELNESFKRLELGGLSQSAEFCKTNALYPPPSYLSIPKPIKPTVQKPIQNNNTSILQGIQKYLRLSDDYQDQTVAELLRQPNQQLHLMRENMILKQEDIKMGPTNNHYEAMLQPCQPQTRKPFASHLLYAFGVPSNFNDLIQETTRMLNDEMQKESVRHQKHVEGQKLEKLLLKSCNTDMVGRLTKEERAEKVRQYLEKKRSRQWLAVRYHVRKNLADQRERVQGRFVKSDKPRFNQSLVNLVSSDGTSSKKGEKGQRKQNSLANSYDFNLST